VYAVGENAVQIEYYPTDNFSATVFLKKTTTSGFVAQMTRFITAASVTHY